MVLTGGSIVGFHFQHGNAALFSMDVLLVTKSYDNIADSRRIPDSMCSFPVCPIEHSWSSSFCIRMQDVTIVEQASES